MTSLNFSNGVTIDSSLILSIESNQQTIRFPGKNGELAHLFNGRPSSLVIHLSDGSTVEINAGKLRLQITMEPGTNHDHNDDARSPNEVQGDNISGATTMAANTSAPLK